MSHFIYLFFLEFVDIVSFIIVFFYETECKQSNDNNNNSNTVKYQAVTFQIFLTVHENLY